MVHDRRSLNNIALTDYQKIIDKYYPAGDGLRDIYMCHCRQVADMALSLVDRYSLSLDRHDIEGAAMLHDIGIFATDAPSIRCFGNQPYIRHGLIGGELLRKEGAPESWIRVAERHTGAGLTVDDIILQNLPLPHIDLCPETLLEKLVCYSDKFFSKSGSMREKSREDVIKGISKFGNDSLRRFIDIEKEICGGSL